MSTQSQVTLCAICGAIVGAAAGYLFFTPQGRALRDQIEPAVDEMKREVQRFQGTIEKMGILAGDSLCVVREFNEARGQAFPPPSTSH